MSTKVISAKISEEEYDKILQSCNEKGCTVSQFVKDACSNYMDSNQVTELQKESDNELVSQLTDKISELGIKLGIAESTILNQNMKLEDLKLFSPDEISQKRFDKKLGQMRFCGHK